MPGFWDYFQQMTDSANQKQMALQDRQMNIANMWMQSAGRDAELAQNYMGMKQGLLGTRAQIAGALDERDRFNKDLANKQYQFGEQLANEKYQFSKGLEESALNRELERMRINKMGASNDNSFLPILLDFIKNNIGAPGFGYGGSLDDVEIKLPQSQKPQVSKQPKNVLPSGAFQYSRQVQQ